jgi:hypothetical protein
MVSGVRSVRFEGVPHLRIRYPLEAEVLGMTTGFSRVFRCSTPETWDHLGSLVGLPLRVERTGLKKGADKIS